MQGPHKLKSQWVPRHRKVQKNDPNFLHKIAAYCIVTLQFSKVRGCPGTHGTHAYEAPTQMPKVFVFLLMLSKCIFCAHFLHIFYTFLCAFYTFSPFFYFCFILYIFACFFFKHTHTFLKSLLLFAQFCSIFFISVYTLRHFFHTFCELFVK